MADVSLPAARLIADAVRRSAHGHLFHFYTLLYEIATVPGIPPTATMKPPTHGPDGKVVQFSSVGGFPSGVVGSDADNDDTPGVEVDARQLAKDCLKQIGREMGAEI